MRFRRRIKVFPGFYLNFSGAGVSSTIGVKGASVNFGKKGTYLNTGIPGTGLYNRQKIGGNKKTTDFNSELDSAPEPLTSGPEIVAGEIKSSAIDQLSSSSLSELRESLMESYADRLELESEIEQTKKKIKTANIIYTISCLLIIGAFIKYFKNNYFEKKEYLADLENQLKNSFIDIDVHFDKSFEEVYKLVLASYKNLLTTEVIWDETASVDFDGKTNRSSVKNIISKSPVKFSLDNVTNIKSTYPAFHFENKNGGDLYIYPAFVVVISTDKKEFGLIDYKDFELIITPVALQEEGDVPSDSEVIRKTWDKVNKNDTPDLRYKGNYEIPVLMLGRYAIKSNTGLNESYLFSNYEKSKDFALHFIAYQNLVLGR